MAITTGIQWCDSACNPTMGCDGCELWNDNNKTCYAGTLHVRFGGSNDGYAPTFEEVTLYPGRMAQAAKWSDLTGKNREKKPWLNGLPRIIFVSDMSDALSSTVPFEFLKTEIVENVQSEHGRRHQWLWLTKRPKRMAEFSRWLLGQNVKWPSNLWAGTSVTTQGTTGRVSDLLEVGDASTIRFLSVEPQHELIDLSEWLPQLDWVIQGGESGHGSKRFDLNWAKSLIDDCQRHGVPFFLKQLGSNVVSNGVRQRFNDAHAGDWTEWPYELRVRQMPRINNGDYGRLELPVNVVQPESIEEGQTVLTAVEAVLKIKELARELGGMNNLKTLADAIE